MKKSMVFILAFILMMSTWSPRSLEALQASPVKVEDIRSVMEQLEKAKPATDDFQVLHKQLMDLLGKSIEGKTHGKFADKDLEALIDSMLEGHTEAVHCAGLWTLAKLAEQTRGPSTLSGYQLQRVVHFSEHGTPAEKSAADSVFAQMAKPKSLDDIERFFKEEAESTLPSPKDPSSDETVDQLPDPLEAIRKELAALKGLKMGDADFNVHKDALYEALKAHIATMQGRDDALVALLGSMLESEMEVAHWAAMWSYGKIAERGIDIGIPTEQFTRIIEFQKGGTDSEREIAEETLRRLITAGERLMQQNETTEVRLDRQATLSAIKDLVAGLKGQKTGSPVSNACKDKLYEALAEYIKDIRKIDPHVRDEALAAQLGSMLEGDVEVARWAAMWAYGTIASFNVNLKPSEAQLKLIEKYAASGTESERSVAAEALERLGKAVSGK